MYHPDAGMRETIAVWLEDVVRWRWVVLHALHFELVYRLKL